MTDAVKTQAELLANLPNSVQQTRSPGPNDLRFVHMATLRNFVFTMFKRGMKDAVRVATAAALPAYTRADDVITADAVGALAAVDGVTLAAGERLLLKDGAAGADNGIYVVTTLGDGTTEFVLTRADDLDDGASAAGTIVPVMEGSTYADMIFVCTDNDGSDVVNTDALTFTLLSEIMGSASAPQDTAATGSAAAGSGPLLAFDDHVHDHGIIADGGVLYHDSDQVENMSGVAGADVSAALDALAAALAAAIAGLDIKQSVTAATAGALAAYTRVGDVITASANGAIGNIDGIAITTGDRILLQDGAAGVDDGIYDVTDAGDGSNPFVLTRSSDMAGGASAAGAVFQAEQGTTYGEDIFVCTNDAGSDVVNTDDLDFTTMTLQSLTSDAPANVTKDTAAVGIATKAARADHKHDISTAAPAATGVGTTSGEGSATSLARSDHSHQSNTAPSDVTKDTAAIGTSGEPARADHKHDISTAAAGAVAPGDSAAEGSATSLARSDHSHGITCAAAGTIEPDDAAAEGVATTFARSDHQHEIACAAAGTIQPDDAAAEGSATSFARSDHQHEIVCAAPSDIGSANAEGSATSFARSDHVHDHAAQADGGSLHHDSDQIENMSGVSGADVSAALDALDTALADQVTVVTKLFVNAGGGAGSDDTEIYNANCPFDCRILNIDWWITDNVSLANVELRDASGGGGNLIGTQQSASSTGLFHEDGSGSSYVCEELSAGDSLYIRRDHLNVGGRVVIWLQRI